MDVVSNRIARLSRTPSSISKAPTTQLTRGLEKGLSRLQRRAASQPIGFELLPKKFTIPQLQALYEAIFQSSLDKRNFRKKILSMGVLVKLEEKDKSSRKGAFLYRFDKRKYQKLVDGGYIFTI